MLKIHIEGKYKPHRLNKIENFVRYAQNYRNKVYSVYDDIGVSDLTDNELKWLSDNGIKFKHVCGLIQFL